MKNVNDGTPATGNDPNSFWHGYINGDNGNEIKAEGSNNEKGLGKLLSELNQNNGVLDSNNFSQLGDLVKSLQSDYPNYDYQPQKSTSNVEGPMGVGKSRPTDVPKYSPPVPLFGNRKAHIPKPYDQTEILLG
ncbi:hypothetical protein BEWA_028830 [Theileria equi strain WA]|uniref:Uncharacterized protein n=1 Tax=Theileria equi strain WA TaxID=1537102 RepID=L0AXQ7_THEEQ|nr:hypothetical protein BEWA_028830 [Theileria equi strain WA]AFZ80033.1 hypothetical protein BEWA_028830 [Theileria equi strain WA]|eukprot:XP_004829699.1 hypothetical protein BEWA_028830 [Theileria equi strain WA]